MNWTSHDETNQKRAIIKLLINMSKTDSALSEKELVYLFGVARKFDINEESVRQLMIDNDETNFTIPKAEIDRMTILYYMLFLMKIDGNVTTEEEKFIYHYGFKLGFGENLLKELIQVIKDNLNKVMPAEALLEKVKKYMN